LHHLLRQRTGRPERAPLGERKELEGDQQALISVTALGVGILLLLLLLLSLAKG
jgi:hypothetical protein